MNTRPLAALALCASALTGCTVHHHHYYAAAEPASPGAVTALADAPGRAALADQLAGVHTAIEVTATNLANANTLGYKARRATFVEGQAQPNITTDWRVGSPQVTERALDVYIEGDGFFQVDIFEEHGGGTGYTRMGHFFVNADGDLVLGNADGPRLSDGIHITGDVISITVSAGGEVMITRPDNSMSSAGQIQLHTFVAPDGLEPIGDGLYIETDCSGPPNQNEPGQGQCGRLAQGMLENSNVNAVTQWVELKKLTRWADAIAEEVGLTEYQHRALTAHADAITPDEPGILTRHDH